VTREKTNLLKIGFMPSRVEQSGGGSPAPYECDGGHSLAQESGIGCPPVDQGQRLAQRGEVRADGVPCRRCDGLLVFAALAARYAALFTSVSSRRRRGRRAPGEKDRVEEEVFCGVPFGLHGLNLLSTGDRMTSIRDGAVVPGAKET
jgi:hypothetical protein